MGTTVNKWDDEEYNLIMTRVKNAADASNAWISERLSSSEVDYLISDYNNICGLFDAVQKFKKATVRLNDLYKAMTQYRMEHEDMQNRSQNKMDNVTEVESVYGSFGNILAGIGTATGTAMAASKAYKFAQHGKTFTADFNDMTEFMNSDVYKLASGMTGLSEISNWGMYYNTISSAITGEENPYVEGLLRSGLKTMVEGIPGSEPVSFSNLDWDIIGAKLGIPNLADYMSPVSDLLNEISNGSPVDDDMIKALGKAIAVAKESLGFFKDAKVLVTILEGFGEATKTLAGLDKAFDACSELFANYFNTYADQISYLETMRNSFEAAGYWTESPVMQQIDLLQTQYEDAVTKSVYYAWEKFGAEKAVDLTKEAVIKNIPVLKTVDTFFDVASKTTVLYGKDKIDAAQELMGYVQYDNMLTQTFEKYSALVESGAATESEIAEADRLLEMLLTLKEKEYEAMKEISKKIDDGWYQTACGKLKQLRELQYADMDQSTKDLVEALKEYGDKVDSIAEGLLDGNKGSSGSSRGGGGRRG